MTVALDLGTTCFRAVRADRRRVHVRSLSAEFVVGDCDAALLATLRRLRRGYLLSDSKLVLVGETARWFAPMLEQTSRPIVSTAEASAPRVDERVLRAALEQILAPAVARGETCLMVVPHVWEHPVSEMVVQTSELIESLGYLPKLASAGHAIVLAAGHRTGFTAIGCSFGAGSMEFSIVRRGRELTRRTYSWGGDWIDARCRELWSDLQESTLELEDVRDWKHSHRIVDSQRNHDIELTLRQAMREALDRALSQTSAAFEPFRGEFSEPIELLAAGGTVRDPGFESTLTEALLRHPLPLAVERLRIVPRPELAVARGLLIHAGIEDLHHAQRAA